jgi:23S rRNA (adenine2503-C2)-methyltransferase
MLKVVGSRPIGRSNLRGKEMELYRSKDGQVSKYVHDDGSETAIKTVSSCGNHYNKLTKKIEPIEVDRNKFTVFMSSSVGCPVGCKFCYLTVKKFPYYKLNAINIYGNVRKALTAELSDKPEIRDKYVKFSFMGMGDAMLLQPEDVRSIALDLCDYAVSNLHTENTHFMGIDGIDISTCMPIGAKRGWQHQYGTLNDELRKYTKNPTSKGRSNLRLFYSLHGAYPNVRKNIMPNTNFDWAGKDIKKLLEFRDWYGVDVIIHHMFLEGINDGVDNVKKLVKIVNDADVELRILRYNECDNSPYKESSKFDELVVYCADHLPHVKYQTSAGSEIKAACGQFLCKTNKE